MFIIQNPLKVISRAQSQISGKGVLIARETKKWRRKQLITPYFPRLLVIRQETSELPYTILTFQLKQVFWHCISQIHKQQNQQRSNKNILLGARKMAQWKKLLLTRAWWSDQRTHLKSSRCGTTCNSSTSEGGRQTQVPGARWLAGSVSSRFCRRPRLSTETRMDTGRHLIPTSALYLYVCVCVQAFVA